MSSPQYKMSRGGASSDLSGSSASYSPVMKGPSSGSSSGGPMPYSRAGIGAPIKGGRSRRSRRSRRR